MRSLQHVIVFLFALFAFALAQDPASYDATVYVTSTVYRVNTVTLSGTPTGGAANSTSTIAAATQPAYSSINGTLPTSGYPSGTLAPSPSSPNPPAFTGAASQLSINAFVAVVAAGVGYLAL